MSQMIRDLAGTSQNARFHIIPTQCGDKYGDNPSLSGGKGRFHRGNPVEEVMAIPSYLDISLLKSGLTHIPHALKTALNKPKWKLSTVSTAPTTTTTFISLKKDFS